MMYLMAVDQETAGAALLRAARTFTGLPYVYGLHDCSWTTETAALRVGIILPRTSEAQVDFYPIKRSVAYKPGDLIFIEGDPIDANPGHVMIYVSPGQVFEAEETGTLIGQKPYDTSQFEFRTRPALACPAAATIEKFGVVAANQAVAKMANDNGWAIRYWNGKSFAITPPNPLRTTTLYVTKDFRKKRN
jgi:cell wall-associated NlpC family hydrolase